MCKVITSKSNYIDLDFYEGNISTWRLACFQGIPERCRRQESWNLLWHLATTSKLPWCVIEDFNGLLYASDKVGKHPHPQALMDDFRAAIEDCNLNELELDSGQFTWEKSIGSSDWVREHLDRAFASQD